MPESKAAALIVTRDKYFHRDAAASMAPHGFAPVPAETALQAARRIGGGGVLAVVADMETISKSDCDGIVSIQQQEGHFPLLLVQPAALLSPAIPGPLRNIEWPPSEVFLRLAAEARNPVVFFVDQTLFVAHALQTSFRDKGLQPIMLESAMGLPEFLVGLSGPPPVVEPSALWGGLFADRRASPASNSIMGHVVGVLFKGSFREASLLDDAVRKAIPAAACYFLSSEPPLHRVLRSLRDGTPVYLSREQTPLIGGLLAAASDQRQSPGHERARLLVFDYERSAVAPFVRALMGAGYAVDVAADPREAEELVRERGSHMAAVIGTNFVKAQESREGLGRALKKADPDIRFIFMVDRFPLEQALKEVSRLLQWGADAALLKPVESAGLLEAVDRSCQRRASGLLRRSSLEAARAAPSPAAEPGHVLRGQYELLSQVGEGGMGIVFKAYDRKLDRFVAVKKMRPELRLNAAQRGQFVAEARTIAKLSHPLIVAIHEIVEEGRDLYLIFNFVEGRTLAEILRERGRLSLGDCRTLFGHVCSAVHSAHQAGILHRDLKPSNIMIDAHGYVKILDFGLARSIKDSLPALTHGDVAGTLAYMAPEQHLGKAVPASDVYSLSVCLYELLTGGLPFKGPDFLAQKERKLYVPPNLIAAYLPTGIEDFMAAGLAPDPRDRIPDPPAFQKALDGLCPVDG